MTQPSTDEISMAAEYFIASECYRRGWVCSIVIGNAKTCDLHVSLPPKSREVKTLEVKSKGPKDGMWTFGKKGCASKNLIYVLVDYRGHFRYHIEHEKRRNTSKHWRPKCYIIPSREMHKYWKKGIGLGQKGGVTLASIRDKKTLHEKWTNIFDDGGEDGPPPTSKKQGAAQKKNLKK